MFGCYKLETFERDLIFEEKLNNKKFEYHWIIDNKLGGISGNTIYIWNEKNWVKYKNVFPLKNQPKLFEDNEFIIIGDCLGEWGGTVYFFEKLLQKHILLKLLVLIQFIKIKMDMKYYQV
jgi:hypothetical protein